MEGVQGNPDYEANDVTFERIVNEHAMKRIGVLAAKDRQIQETEAYKTLVRRDVDTIILNQFILDKVIDPVLPDSLVRAIHAKSSPQYKMSVIKRTIKTSSTDSYIAQQKMQIDAIYDQLKQGGSFQILAKKYSQDKSVQYNGGDIGFMFSEAFSEPVLRTVMDTMKVNSFSKPVRGYNGFYILKKGRGMNIDVPPYEEVKDDLFKIVRRSRQYELMARAQEYFEHLAPKYKYSIDQNNLSRITDNMIKTKLVQPLVQQTTESKEHLNWILARLESDSVTMRDVYTEAPQFPQDLDQFLEQFQNVVQNRIFALEAREQGYLNHPELKDRIQYTEEQTLRTLLFKQEVQDKARQILAGEKSSTPADNTIRLHELEQKLRGEFENSLKKQYNLQIDKSKFTSMIALAKLKKQEYLDVTAPDDSH